MRLSPLADGSERCVGRLGVSRPAVGALAEIPNLTGYDSYPVTLAASVLGFVLAGSNRPST